MKILKCIETGKITRFNNNVPDYELDEILSFAANRLLRREKEHKYDFVCVGCCSSELGLRSEIYHGLGGDLTEHTGEYRTFVILSNEKS